MKVLGDARYKFLESDAAKLPIEDQSCDLVFCSPPYEDARTYGLNFALRGDKWVDWAVGCFQESLRICRGLVAWVVNGRTKDYRWSASPALMLAELHRRGVVLRKPPIFSRVGIPGSGGKDWLRDDYEFIIVATAKQGRLPWSENTALGAPPKYRNGGRFSNRTVDGKRADGSYPSELKVANPGNVVHRIVGGGHMGHPLANQNEAPFPESLADFFIRSFCPPDGIVVDPFSGSGTTVAAAVKAGRRGVGLDIRATQVALGERRLREVMEELSVSAAEPATKSDRGESSAA